MIPKILTILGIVFFIFILLAIYSCFVMSGRISEFERQRDSKNSKN